MSLPPGVAAELDQLAADLSARLEQAPEYWAAEKMAYDAAFDAAWQSGSNATQCAQYASAQARPMTIDSRRHSGQTEAVRIRYEHLKFMVEHGAV